MLGWIQANYTIPTTIALKEAQSSYLWRIFTKNLHVGEYCTFFNGKVIITVFEDASTVRTVSTCFKVGGKNSLAFSTITRSNFELCQLPPHLSESDIAILATMSIEGLKVIWENQQVL